MNAPAAMMGRRQQAAAEPTIRLMIVDDSPVARAVLSRMVCAHADFELVATAGSAAEAIDALRCVKVDIVLLDVEMPGGSGLEALPEIVKRGQGARVLVVSSMAEEGAATTVQALALGAADTLPKPGTGNFAGRFSQILAERVRRIGPAPRGRRADRDEEAPKLRLRAMPDWKLGCLALGASTGGLHALNEFLRALPARIDAPILVTQHLPPTFMVYFARQLESACGREARVAEEGAALRPDIVHIAPGDAHLALERRGSSVRVRLDRKRALSGCLPSADPMLASVGEAYGKAGLGVILSGMGRDGLVGSRALVDAGGAMLAQDRASAAIWGMPRVVAEAGLASAVLAPAELARRVAERVESESWK